MLFANAGKNLDEWKLNKESEYKLKFQIAGSCVVIWTF